MRGNLWDDPRVGRLCDMTGATEAQVIGSLYWLWTSADQHTENGFMPGLSLRQIDRKTGLPGFGAALVDIGWVEDGKDGVTILNFSEHNGSSAKRRCMDAQRKANDRAGVREVSAPEADNLQKVADESGQVAELEKEKSKSNTSPNGEEARKRAPACPDDVERQVWSDWLQLRKAKKAPVTETTITEARREAGKAGISFEAFLRAWCRRGSQGLEASWLKPEEKARGSPSETAHQRHMRERMAQFAPSAAVRPPDDPPTAKLAEVIDVTARRLG